MLQLDVLRACCATSASWRNVLVIKYPHDASRNAKARDLLQALAAMPDDSVRSETRQQLARLDGQALVKAMKEACRTVGFKFYPFGLDDLAAAVVEIASPANQVEAAR
jgi:hypothetical protein